MFDSSVDEWMSWTEMKGHDIDEWTGKQMIKGTNSHMTAGASDPFWHLYSTACGGLGVRCWCIDEGAERGPSGACVGLGPGSTTSWCSGNWEAPFLFFPPCKMWHSRLKIWEWNQKITIVEDVIIAYHGVEGWNYPTNCVYNSDTISTSNDPLAQMWCFRDLSLLRRAESFGPARGAAAGRFGGWLLDSM